MSIVTKRPPLKETVGAQYYCFATKEDDSTEFTGKYEENVTKTNTVKTVSVSENGESTPVYASGDVYDTADNTSTHSIEVEVVAVEAQDLDKMRGEVVTESGLVLTNMSQERPYFAYGKVVKLKGGHVRFDWYPKCKLVENTDETSTKEESFSEQNETLTITAYPFDEAGNIKVKHDSTYGIADWMTEDLFFSKPILTEEDFLSLKPTESGE